MKKSNKLFAGLIGLLLLVVIYPPIAGSYMGKGGNPDQPSDFLSKFWKSFDDTLTTDVVDKGFKHVKLVGDGKRTSLYFNQAETNTVRGNKLKYFATEVNGDTLVITKLTQNLYYLDVSLVNKIESVIIQNCDLSLAMDSVSFSAAPYLIVANNSTVNLYDRGKVTPDPLPSLRIALSGESRLYMSGTTISKVDATIDNGLIRYASDFVVDTMDVTLIGKSSVSSTAPTEVNAVKNLIVKKDIKYFNPNLVGKNVNLIAQKK